MILVSGKEQQRSPFFRNLERKKRQRQLATDGNSDSISPINLVHFYFGETGIQTIIIFNSDRTPADLKNET